MIDPTWVEHEVPDFVRNCEATTRQWKLLCDQNLFDMAVDYTRHVKVRII